MKKILLLIAAMILLAAFETAAGEEAGTDVVNEISTAVSRMIERYEDKDYHEAVLLADEAKGMLNSVDKNDRITNTDIFNQSLKMVYNWLDPDEKGNNRLIGQVANMMSVSPESADEFTDGQIQNVTFNLSLMLDLVQRNALYYDYRRMEDEGTDIYSLDWHPYKHNRDWKDFSAALGFKYQKDAEEPSEYSGGKKLLIIGLRNANEAWTAELPGHISPMELAISEEEVGYILRLEWDRKQLTRTVIQPSGKEVGGTYQTILNVSFTDLAAGETKKVGTYYKSPMAGEVPITPGAGEYEGKFTSRDVTETFEKDICPVLEQYIHVYK